MSTLSDAFLLQLSTTLDQLGREHSAQGATVSRNRTELDEMQRVLFGRDGATGLVARLASLEESIRCTECEVRALQRGQEEQGIAIEEVSNNSKPIIVPPEVLLREHARTERLRISSRTKVILGVVAAIAGATATLLKLLGIV